MNVAQVNEIAQIMAERALGEVTEVIDLMTTTALTVSMPHFIHAHTEPKSVVLSGFDPSWESGDYSSSKLIRVAWATGWSAILCSACGRDMSDMPVNGCANCANTVIWETVAE